MMLIDIQSVGLHCLLGRANSLRLSMTNKTAISYNYNYNKGSGVEALLI